MIKKKDDVNDDNPLSTKHKWTPSDNGFDNNVNSNPNKEDEVICKCSQKNSKNGSIDRNGFNQCMNDLNGNTADDWKRASDRIQHWSKIYQSKYQNNGIATGNAMNDFGHSQYTGSGYSGGPSMNNVQSIHSNSSPTLDFTVIAIVCSIFGVVFLILFGWQCVRSSWKYWNMREYETIGVKKSKITFVDESTPVNNV